MREFEFTGIGDCKSVCGLDIIPCGDMNVVCVTELAKNLGTTVANGTESLLNCIVHQLGVDLDTVVWIVHFPDGLIPGQREIYMLVQGTREQDDSLRPNSLSWSSLTASVAMEFLLGDNPMIGEEIRLLPPA